MILQYLLHVMGFAGISFLTSVQVEPGACLSISMYTRACETRSLLIIDDNCETPSPLLISSSKTSGLTLLGNILKTRERVFPLPPPALSHSDAGQLLHAPCVLMNCSFTHWSLMNDLLRLN